MVHTCNRQVCLWSIDRLTNAIVMSQRALRQNGSRAASPPDVPYVEEVLEVLRGNIGAVVEVCAAPVRMGAQDPEAHHQ